MELVLENIIYGELRLCGYTVEMGWRGSKEVDFVPWRWERTWYVQVSYLLADQVTAEREFGVLKAIPDNQPATVVSMDPVTRGRNGIKHVSIVDFLMADPSVTEEARHQFSVSRG